MLLVVHIKDEPSIVLLAHTSTLVDLHVANRIEEKTKADELVSVLVQSDNSLVPFIEEVVVMSIDLEINPRVVVTGAIIAAVSAIAQDIIARVPKREEVVY